jgi:hypothetical protein
MSKKYEKPRTISLYINVNDVNQYLFTIDNGRIAWGESRHEKVCEACVSHYYRGPSEVIEVDLTI